MKPVKLAVLCSVLVIAACGDKSEEDTAKSEPKSLIEQTQQAIGNAADSVGKMASGTDETAGKTAEGAPKSAAATTDQTPAPAADDQAAAAGEKATDMAQAGQETAADKAAAAAAVAPAAGGEAPASDADLALGKSIYEGKCSACHATGAAGSPKLDDKANWAPRIAQGMETLVKHAMEGFKGSVGYMPPKGGFATLTDDEVKAAVGYMVSQAK